MECLSIEFPVKGSYTINMFVPGKQGLVSSKLKVRVFDQIVFAGLKGTN